MNKKYKVSPESNITILNGEEEIKREEKYTDNTDEILSLENVSINLENKICKLKDNLNELKEESIDNKNNITTLLLVFICCVIVALLSTKSLFLIKIFSELGIAYSLISTAIMINKQIQKQKEIKKQQKRITEEINRKSRINKRIEVLSKNKKISLPKKINEYIEIKPIYDFRFTPTDYFIENYQIEKRAKEMTKGKKKIKKRNNSSQYEEYKI